MSMSKKDETYAAIHAASSLSRVGVAVGCEKLAHVVSSSMAFSEVSGQPRRDPTSELESIFKEFDIDGDGAITQSEFQQSLKKLGLSPTNLEINAMFTAADRNKDGKIRFKEFQDLISNSPALSSLQHAFQQFDLDNDGGITFAELKKVMKQLGQEANENELNMMFKAADVNNDGIVSFEEFSQMMKRHPLVLNLREVFRQFDMDKDGYISESELRIVCRQLSVPATDREVAIMFQAADKNGDGKISFDEFSYLLTDRNK